VTPDRAELLVRVESRATLAGAASDANSRLAQAVIDTLRRGFALGGQEVTTISVTVRQEMTYPGDGRPPRVTGYVASNTIRVRTSQIARIGAAFDAVVSKGATGVDGPMFFAADSSEYRRQALSRAVEQARRDAEAMALAAGGTLGDLLEMTSEPTDPGNILMPRMAMAQARAEADTPVAASDLRISASVIAKWRFVRPNR
jgi:uncharacterized protein YggE